MKMMILVATTVAMLCFAGRAAPVFEARLASVAIEGRDIKGLSADARAELEKHLSLVAGGAGRCAVACFWLTPFFRHAPVSVPYSVAHSGPPLKQASRLRSRLCMPCHRQVELVGEGRMGNGRADL